MWSGFHETPNSFVPSNARRQLLRHRYGRKFGLASKDVGTMTKLQQLWQDFMVAANALGTEIMRLEEENKRMANQLQGVMLATPKGYQHFKEESDRIASDVIQGLYRKQLTAKEEDENNPNP